LGPKYRLQVSIHAIDDEVSEVRITPGTLTTKIIDLYFGEFFQHEVEAELAKD
jgi:hypothetical protein